MRLPRTLSKLIIRSAIRSAAVAALAGVPAAFAPAAFAQPAAADATAAPAINPEMRKAAADFFHFATVGRYELAKDVADKILASGAAPADVLRAFNAEVQQRNEVQPAERRVSLYDHMEFFGRRAELKDTIPKLIDVFNQANKEVSADPVFIEQQIKRLAVNRRAYDQAIEQLRNSGEMAVPVMVAYLRDPAKAEYHTPIRQALRDLGVRVLNPLLAATELKDPAVVPWLLSALGELGGRGYAESIPYLVRIAKDKDQPENVRAAAANALSKMGTANLADQNAAALFHDLAERFYYNKSVLTPSRDASEALIWSVTPDGLAAKSVPAQTFNEDMTLRATEAALRLDPARTDSAALWLAAGYKREADIPEGKTDTFWDATHPPTHFYATASGVTHLNPVLARAIRDRDHAVALKAIKSLQSIVGASGITGADNPIVAAMNYPDRQVRFEAALTAAEALPQQPFTGQERVVPILGEALSQTGKPGVLAIASADVEKFKETLKNYTVETGSSAANGVANAAKLPSVDVIIVREGDEPLEAVTALTRGNPRLENAAKLIISQTPAASAYAGMAANDPTVSIIQDTDAADEAKLNAAIEEARKRAGGLPIDEKLATEFALRAASALQRLAVSRTQVLDLAAAQPSILAGLDDARAEVATAAGNVAALLGSREAQVALANKGLDDKTPDEFKVSLLRNLATNAKTFNNQLDTGTVENLQKLAETAMNPDVKSASAEALGALNLRSEQVKTLILNQAK